MDKIFIAFVRQNSFYSKLATWLIGGPYHHTLVYWYDEDFEDYMGIEITPCGGIKIHNLKNILKNYNKTFEVYYSEQLTKDSLSLMKDTIGMKYDLSLLIKDLFVLLNHKIFKFYFKPKKKNKDSFICSEWVTILLKKLFSKDFFNLTPHLTSPEMLRQALKENSKFKLKD